MEQSEYINQLIFETFIFLFSRVFRFEFLFLLVSIALGIYFFKKKKRRLLFSVGFIGIILFIDLIHTGVSLWISSSIKVQHSKSENRNYLSIYRDTTIREDFGRIDTIHSYYLNLYGFGPKYGESFLYHFSFWDKFTQTYLIDFRVVKTPIRLQQYFYIKQKTYPFYSKFTETDYVKAMFINKHLEFTVYSNKSFSSDEYLQTLSFLKKGWENKTDIIDISVKIEKFTNFPKEFSYIDTLFKGENTLRVLTVGTLVRLGEK